MSEQTADAVPGKAADAVVPMDRIEFETLRHDGVIWPGLPKLADPPKLPAKDL